jgi:(S)-mandelate dehydrogenase
MSKMLMNVQDYREAARHRLSSIAFDYLDTGADDELTMRRNREVLQQMAFNPRILAGVSAVDLSAKLFGRVYPLPVVIGPVGFCGLFWPDGDLAVAHAAARTALPYVAATLGTATVEEVAAVSTGERWFQSYAFKDDGRTDALIARAQQAGYTGLVLTVDSAVSGNREASARHGAQLPVRITVPLVIDVLGHPRWAYQMLRYGAPRLKNVENSNPAGRGGAQTPFSFDALIKKSLGWDDVARIRKVWPGVLILKGIQSGADSRRAEAAGVDGIVLSNHGGRQLDGSPSTMEVLPEVVATVDKKIPVMVDSGFRRGGEIVKALALGADAVWLGRAPIYGLAARGEKGVLAVIEILRQEMERTMFLLGAEKISQLGPHCLRA